ncbi:hypothetical protein [Bromus-associated circular DNA virus 2]|uniref:hypothetical protein n=1 Tax=Bromus-associated circular DNA virus 2 TaxID=1590155 RepID=UPI00058605DE|nr:hypothetical protein [Bromus-associated circular DNA virus 2]AJC52527.1 hypothetical protein [Bromus-associated circular DNA virus 2]
MSVSHPLVKSLRPKGIRSRILSTKEKEAMTHIGNTGRDMLRALIRKDGASEPGSVSSPPITLTSSVGKELSLKQLSTAGKRKHDCLVPLNSEKRKLQRKEKVMIQTTCIVKQARPLLVLPTILE